MSDQNFDKLYKLVEQVLLSTEVSLEEVYKFLLDINIISINLASKCLSNVHDQISNTVCNKSYKIIDEVIDTVLKFLIIRFFEGSAKPNKDSMSRLYTTVLSTIGVIKNIVKNSLIIQEEKVLCKVIKPITLHGDIVGKGYVVLLPIDLATVLSALGYVELVYSKIEN